MPVPVDHPGITRERFIDVVQNALAELADPTGRVNLDPNGIAEELALRFFPRFFHKGCPKGGDAPLFSDGYCPSCSHSAVPPADQEER